MSDDVAQHIARLVQRQAEERGACHAVRSNQPLSSELDSLGVLSLLVDIEKTLGVELPEPLWGGTSVTLDQLVEAVRELHNQ